MFLLLLELSKKNDRLAATEWEKIKRKRSNKMERRIIYQKCMMLSREGTTTTKIKPKQDKTKTIQKNK